MIDVLLGIVGAVVGFLLMEFLYRVSGLKKRRELRMNEAKRNIIA